MTTRIVLDVICDIHGNPIPGATGWFGLTKSSYTGDAAYMRTPVPFTADEQGRISVGLWCDEEGAIATRYEATYPADKFRFDLPVGDGSPVLMSSLRAASPGIPTANLSTLVDAHAALEVSETSSGHVKVDGTTITATDGVIGITEIDGGTP